MALYTITLSDYLKEGGILPQAFTQIDNFTDLFIGQYFECEIGFETTDLFYLKLEQKAVLKIPYYKDKINKINAKIQSLENVNKTFTTNNGKQTTTSTILPTLNATTETEPNAITESEEYINSNAESGLNVAENIALLKAYKEEYNNVIEDLLNEFKDLFMMIY